MPGEVPGLTSKRAREYEACCRREVGSDAGAPKAPPQMRGGYPSLQRVPEPRPIQNNLHMHYWHGQKRSNCSPCDPDDQDPTLARFQHAALTDDNVASAAHRILDWIA